MLDTFIGTPLYLSPELVDNKPYNEKTDLWSLGVILYELCALTVPFRAKNVLSLANMIRAGRYEPLPGIYSPAMERCVPWLLNVNYLNRPTINQVLAYVEDKLVPGYHGEDMAAEYDSLPHSIKELIQPADGVHRPPEGEGVEVEEVEVPSSSLPPHADGKSSAYGSRRSILSHPPGDSSGSGSEDSLSLAREREQGSRVAGIRSQQDQDQDQEDRPAHKQYHKRRPSTAGAALSKPTARDPSREEVVEGDGHPPRRGREGRAAPAEDLGTLIQFEVSRISALLRRETAQLSRLLKLKEFFDASALGGGAAPLKLGLGEGAAADSSVEVRVRQVRERIRILERCLQNGGAITRMEIKK